MKYAVVQLQGKQYKVKEGQKLTVDHLEAKVGDTWECSDVLMIANEGKFQIGSPLVKGAKVGFKVLEQGKDEKIRVFKYKSKSKYRKIHGHRQQITNLEVVSIA